MILARARRNWGEERKLIFFRRLVLFAGFLDEGLELGKFFGGDVLGITAEAGGYGSAEGAVEEDVENLGESGLGGGRFLGGGLVNEFAAFFDTGHAALSFEEGEEGADGISREIVGHLGGDLGDGGGSLGVEDVHDLSLAAGELSFAHEANIAGWQRFVKLKTKLLVLLT